jgi:DNA recombination protein RmuC
MEPILIVATALVGTALGGVIGWLAAARRTGAAEATAAALRQQLDDARARGDLLERSLREADARRVEHETAGRELERSLGEQRRLLDEAEGKLGDTFQALAAQALQQSNQGFLALAAEKLGSLREQASGDLEARQRAIEGIVKPVRESIEKVDKQIRSRRSGARPTARCPSRCAG